MKMFVNFWTNTLIMENLKKLKKKLKEISISGIQVERKVQFYKNQNS